MVGTNPDERYAEYLDYELIGENIEKVNDISIKENENLLFFEVITDDEFIDEDKIWLTYQQHILKYKKIPDEITIDDINYLVEYVKPHGDEFYLSKKGCKIINNTANLGKVCFHKKRVMN